MSAVEGKVVSVHAMNVCGRVQLYLHSFLTSALGGW